MFVCPFPTDPKFWKIRGHLKKKKKKYNSTPTTNHLLQIQLLPPRGLNQFWGSACPRINTHEWYCILYKKKKKKKPYRPSRFSDQKGKQTFFIKPNSKLTSAKSTLFELLHHMMSEHDMIHISETFLPPLSRTFDRVSILNKTTNFVSLRPATASQFKLYFTKVTHVFAFQPSYINLANGF